jgi:membrane associated rhomboid family serine protease
MGISANLLAVLAVVFVLQLIIPPLTGAFVFDPALAFSQPWRFVTSMFLHADLTHIFFNGYALFLFGSMLERKVSSRDYLIIYFGAGLLGGLFYYGTYALGMIPDIPALGASGAIYGILGACAFLFPGVRLLFLGFIPMSMRTAAIAWFVMEFLGTFDISSGVASAAHLGGLIFGFVCGWYLMNRGRQPPPVQYYEERQSYPWQNENPG